MTETKVQQNPLTSAEKRNMVITAVVIMFLLGNCAYNAGKPWNCAQADEKVEEAQQEYDDAYRDGMAQRVTDGNTINRVYLKSQMLSYAKDKQLEMCR